MIQTEIAADMAIPSAEFYGQLDPETRALRAHRASQAARRRRQSLPRLMAAIMVERVAGHGACDLADLRCAGFTQAEIEAHRDEAVLMARGAATP